MATAAAAIVAKARRHVISHLMRCNAVSPETAVAWVPERAIQQRMLARFVDRGVVIARGSDRYFLDLPAYDRWSRKRRRLTAGLLAAVVIAGGIAALA